MDSGAVIPPPPDGFSLDIPPPPPGFTLVGTDKPAATAGDRAQAAASGFNRGALVNLLGLPVSTALNVADLAKAAYGSAGHALGFLPTEDMPQMTDRAKMVGSPEWIAQQLESRGAGQTINANRPDDTASRYLHAGGQGAAMALAAPQTGASAMVNGLTGAGSQVAGQAAADAGVGPAGQILASLAAPAATVAGVNRAQRAQTANDLKAQQRSQVSGDVNEAMDAGYVFPPAQTNPTLMNKIVGGIAGKAATEQQSSIVNQDITAAGARTDLGLPPGAPLSAQTLQRVRSDAGKVYEQVKSFGPLADPQGNAKAELQQIAQDYASGTGGMPALRIPAVESVIKNLATRPLDSQTAVGLMRRLRQDADAAYRSGEPEKGQVYRKVSGAIENLLEENLAAAGAPGLDDFRSARQAIARSYDVQDAMANGGVSGSALANSDSPLTGNLALAAKAGAFAPRATRNFDQTPPGLSVHDAMIAASGAVPALATGHPGFAATAAWPFLRMGARALALSKPYQNMFGRPPDYQPNFLTRQMLESAPTALALGSSQESERLLQQPQLAALLRQYGLQQQGQP